MNTATQTVREIALEEPSSIRVFENFGIDYCCGGRKPLSEACAASRVDVDAVIAALEEAVAGACALNGGLVAEADGRTCWPHRLYASCLCETRVAPAGGVGAKGGESPRLDQDRTAETAIPAGIVGRRTDPASCQGRGSFVSVHCSTGARPGSRKSQAGGLFWHGCKPCRDDDAGARCSGIAFG